METVVLNKIEYSFYDYRVTWDEARIICSGRKAQLTSLDTEEKARVITQEASESSLGKKKYI